ncbi:MAG: hypothetical protein H0W72_17590 [Planctomycetes bacterium]|nr:hypothetical protein [Planctomycetota bacterium]
MRLRSLVLTSTLTALALGSPLAAADQGINDLRGLIGFWPANHESGNSEFGDDSYRIAIEYMRSLKELEDIGGFIWGIDLSYTDSGFDGGGDAQAIVVTGHAGWAYALEQVPELHFEGTGFLGLGNEQVDPGDSDGLYREFGLRAAGYYTFDSDWQVGLDLRLVLDAESNQDGGDLENDGLAVLFGFGKRL